MPNERDSSTFRPAPVGYEYAGPLVRLVALIIDGILLAALAFAVTFAIGIVVGAVVPLDVQRDSGLASLDFVGWPDGAVYYVVTSILMFAWYGAWQSSTGSTPGMKLVRLRVVDPSLSAKPGFTAAAVRNAPVILGSFGPIAGDETVDAALGFVTLAVYVAIGLSISNSPTRQGLHDRLAGGTYVVRPLPAVALDGTTLR